MKIRKMKTYFMGFAMTLAMSLSFSMVAMAASPVDTNDSRGMIVGELVEIEGDVPTTRGSWNPTFFSGDVFAYKTSTDETRWVGSGKWSWWPVQPPHIDVAKEDYWEVAGERFDSWYFQYDFNSKDSTYIKITDGRGDTCIDTSVKPNTLYKLKFYVRGMTSVVDLKIDWKVGQAYYQGASIGGMEVNYN